MDEKVDYHAMYVWADTDRHRLINLEWLATKRARQAESQVEKLRKQLLDNDLKPVV